MHLELHYSKPPPVLLLTEEVWVVRCSKSVCGEDTDCNLNIFYLSQPLSFFWRLRSLHADSSCWRSRAAGVLLQRVLLGSVTEMN